MQQLQIELNFQELKSEVESIFGENRLVVLATSLNDKVTARTMSCVFDGIRIQFQTGINSEKANQIRGNPNVALCFDNMQIEGMAVIKGHPLDESNKEFASKYKRHYEGSFSAYSGLEEEILVEIIPIKVTIWKYHSGKPVKDYLCVSDNKAYREVLDFK